ncbi:hypothetical protein psyc5s11_20120 [Clostridium gelidum]|uniref:Uncharacterized protein n=1 Tax=Clostridium gelidum TaxID=704125 RepID=A0ABN6IUS6_9CLOT|nr:hypothetical protein psyc5s11_20120 [Clostridium gelidum]
MDFKAPTNKEPRMTTGFATSGKVKAKIIPIIKPTIICFTRLN